MYKSTATNTGEPTYYFRGNVENNYVSFASQTWRIVRINEDGTVRIVMQDGINNNTNYQFNSNYNNYTYMYYSNSNAKTILENWYQTNIGSKADLAKNVASDNYYCEQAKVSSYSYWTAGNANILYFTSYTPNFKCSTDGNGKGQINSSIGLLTYDEAVYAGGYNLQNNSSYYLQNGTLFWTMSPSGFSAPASGSSATVWILFANGNLYNCDYTTNNAKLRPVINLKTNTKISSGNGTKNNPYILS